MLTVQWDRDTYLIHHCLLKPNYYRRWRWRMGTKERRRRESLGPWYQGWEQKRSHIFDSWTFSNTPHFSNFCQIPILYKLILEYSSSSSTLHTIHLKLMKYCTSIILQLKKKLTWLGIIPFQEGKKKKNLKILCKVSPLPSLWAVTWRVPADLISALFPLASCNPTSCEPTSGAPSLEDLPSCKLSGKLPCQTGHPLICVCSLWANPHLFSTQHTLPPKASPQSSPASPLPQKPQPFASAGGFLISPSDLGNDLYIIYALETNMPCKHLLTLPPIIEDVSPLCTILISRTEAWKNNLGSSTEETLCISESIPRGGEKECQLDSNFLCIKRQRRIQLVRVAFSFSLKAGPAGGRIQVLSAELPNSSWSSEKPSQWRVCLGKGSSLWPGLHGRESRVFFF